MSKTSDECVMPSADVSSCTIKIPHVLKNITIGDLHWAQCVSKIFDDDKPLTFLL